MLIATKFSYPYSTTPFTLTLSNGSYTELSLSNDNYYSTGVYLIDSTVGASLTVNVYFGYTGGGKPEGQLVYLY